MPVRGSPFWQFAGKFQAHMATKFTQPSTAVAWKVSRIAFFSSRSPSLPPRVISQLPPRALAPRQPATRMIFSPYRAFVEVRGAPTSAQSGTTKPRPLHRSQRFRHNPLITHTLLPLLTHASV